MILTPSEIFRNAKVVEAIKTGALKPNGESIKRILPSGSTMDISYKYESASELLKRQIKYNMSGNVEERNIVRKKITRPNGAYTLIEYKLSGDQLQLSNIIQKSSEGAISQKFKNKVADGGLVWTTGGEIIWKYEGGLRKPKNAFPYSDPYDSATIKDIADYVRLTMNMGLKK